MWLSVLAGDFAGRLAESNLPQPEAGQELKRKKQLGVWVWIDTQGLMCVDELQVSEGRRVKWAGEVEP